MVICLKIKVISKKGENFRFLLEGANPAFANTLRRIMISEVPNMTIDSVEFQDNTSALFDEIIAHRMGMIPLQFDPDKFNVMKDCKCEGKGCPSCQVFFALEKTGPAMVYSSDLKSSNKSVRPTSPDFPIVKLLKDQHLKMEATARLGTGREHAKFQSANVAYNYLPTIEASSSEDFKRVVSACPKGVLEVKNRKLVLVDPYACNECKMCEETDEGVKMKGDPTKFVFKVESISGLEPEYIVERAVQILEEKAKDFKEQLKEV
jgi:DNA-directed RNA polymerase subunit D